LEAIMPEVSEIISFLDKYELRRGGESPWPSFDQNSRNFERSLVDWDALFPPGERTERLGNYEWDMYGDDWVPEFGQDFLSALEKALSQAPPTETEIAQMAEANRWDVCAWYEPIHYYGSDWGIYVRMDCILSQALRVARFLRKPAPPSRSLARALVRASTYAYFLHEQYHHKVESLAIRLQVVERHPIYIPYTNHVYLPAQGTDDQLEEALANADIFRRLPTDPYEAWISSLVVKATRYYLSATFPHEPPGYRKAVSYLGVTLFEAGENLLHSRVHEATLKPTQPAADWLIATRLMQSLFRVTDNIWLLVTPGGRPMLPTQPWP